MCSLSLVHCIAWLVVTTTVKNIQFNFSMASLAAQALYHNDETDYNYIFLSNYFTWNLYRQQLDIKTAVIIPRPHHV